MSHVHAVQVARDLMAARGRVMTFGKYKNQTVGELPLNYIRWALKTCHGMPYNVRRAMQIVLEGGSK